MILLTDEDLERILPMPEAMAAVEQVLVERRAGSAVSLPRTGLYAGDKGLVFTPGALPGAGVAGLRVYPVGTASDEQLVAVWDLEQGALQGLVAGNALGAIRTGAIGGVAVSLMAAPEARVVGVIGAGRQARTQLLAIRAVRPISRVLIYRRDASGREETARGLSAELGLPVEAAPSAQDAVSEADIVVTATPSPEPVIRPEWLKPGAHVNSLGPKYRGRSEIGLDLVERAAWLVSDFPEQYRREPQFILQETPHLDRLQDLAELHATRPQRPGGAVTLFLSHGLAGTEVAAAAAAFRRAVELGAGRRVDAVDGVGISYLAFEGLPEGAVFDGILRLHGRIFGEGQSDGIRAEAPGKQRLLTIVAMSGDQVVGYKMGYERKPGHFYSWLGGVAPEFRKRGIGSELMRRQHHWCRAHGYHTIRTTTKNKWRDMIVLNLRHGFDVIGSYTDDKGEPKLILEKRIGS